MALRCDAPYTRHCDVDVHFHVNRACAGRARCAVPVSSTVFGDPCGYDEFLIVSYHCTPGQSRCLSSAGTATTDHLVAAIVDVLGQVCYLSTSKRFVFQTHQNVLCRLVPVMRTGLPNSKLAFTQCLIDNFTREGGGCVYVSLP